MKRTTVDDVELATLSCSTGSTLAACTPEIGNIPPVGYQQTYYRQQQAQEVPISSEPGLD